MLNYEIIIIMIMEKILKYWNEISYLFLEMSPFLVLGFARLSFPLGLSSTIFINFIIL